MSAFRAWAEEHAPLLSAAALLFLAAGVLIVISLMRG